MRIVIVGNGVAGISCALAARRRDGDAEITVVGDESDYFFSRPGLMYVLLGEMPRRALEPYERAVYDAQRIRRVRGKVIDVERDPNRVQLESGDILPWDRLVLATGSRAVRPSWHGLDDARVGVVHLVTLSDLADCERWFPSTRRAVVVGGGLIGIEMVECLVHFGMRVTFLVREPWYWPAALGREEGEMVADRLRAVGVEVLSGEEVRAVHADGAGRVRSVETTGERSFACELLGIAAGVVPNVAAVAKFGAGVPVRRGVVVDACLRSRVPGVFACGDCAEIERDGAEPLIESVWYSAKRQGERVAGNLFGDGRPYEPTTWYNSAKFLDIEYTTVGRTGAKAPVAASLYRRHRSGRASQRILHESGVVVGFNMLGSRWDHGVLVRWIEERRELEWVRRHLGDAQFDVEFGRLAIEDCEERDCPAGGENRAELPR